jgi:hypothetical protein
MPATDPTDSGSLLDGAMNVAEAIGEMFGDPPPAPKPSGKAAPDIIETTATVISDEPVKPAEPPPAGQPHAPTAPPVEARQADGRAFLPSELAVPLYRLAAAVELLNQDFTAARAAGKLGDHPASGWAGWRGDLLAWGTRLAAGDYPHDDPGGVAAGIARRRAKVPKWRDLLERESGRTAVHSRGTAGGTVAGVQTSARAEPAAPGLWDGLPLLIKGALVLGIGWGAVQVVPAIIDAITEPLGRTATAAKTVVTEGV